MSNAPCSGNIARGAERWICSIDESTPFTVVYFIKLVFLGVVACYGHHCKSYVASKCKNGGVFPITSNMQRWYFGLSLLVFEALITFYVILGQWVCAMNSWQGGVVQSCVVCMIARMYQFRVQVIESVDWDNVLSVNAFGVQNISSREDWSKSIDPKWN